MNAILPQKPFMAPPDLMALAWIANNLRECDAKECFNGAIATPERLAIAAYQTTGFCDVAWVDGKPAAAVGGQPLWPGVWSAWAWGTDDWHKVRLLITRHILRKLIPAMLEAGARRGECASHEEHHEAHSWLEFLGFKCEGRLRGYGRDGSDFLLYAWLNADSPVRWWGRRQYAVASETE